MKIKSVSKKFGGLLVLAMLLLTFLSFALLTACGNNDDASTVGDTGQKQLWTCGMHPQVIQDEPGNCPICGMKLVPVKSGSMGDSEEEHTQAEHEKMTEDQGMANKSDKKDKKILYWRAPMDPTYISDKPGKSPMGMDLVPVYEGEEPGGGATITIDPVTVQNMGVRTAEVKRQPFYRVIRTVGHIDYNEEKLYNINVKFPGWIEELYVDETGEQVRKGQPLFKIYSPDLVATQEEYTLAYNNQKKLATSEFNEISSGANRLLEAARKRLKYWDISDQQIEELEKTGEVRKTLTIYSPANGVVVHKNAVEGVFTKEGADLFRIADLSTVWVLAHIFEYELPWVKLGQKVEMELPYVPGKKFEGTVEYIYPFLNAKTRDVRIRLVFKNPTLELKPEMYANIKIESRIGEDELVIPSEAVIRSGKRDLVFIALGNGKFRPQEVVLGPEGDEGQVKVAEGLHEGQTIVTSAQFLLDSESRLREAIQKMLEARSGTGNQPMEMQQNEQEMKQQH